MSDPQPVPSPDFTWLSSEGLSTQVCARSILALCSAGLVRGDDLLIHKSGKALCAQQIAVLRERLERAPVLPVGGGAEAGAGSLGRGVLWCTGVALYAILSGLDWPGFFDGLALARVQVLGLLGLWLTAPWALRGMWRALGEKRGVYPVLLKLSAMACSAAIGTIGLALCLNAPLLFVTAAGHDPLGQAEVRLVSERAMEVRGPLVAGVAARAAHLLKEHPHIQQMHLNSPGGWIREGLGLSQLIQTQHLSVATRTGCYSACTLAYLAGTSRQIAPDARLGFHSSAGFGTDALYLNYADTLMGDRFKALQVDEATITHVLATHAPDLWAPRTEVLLREHLVDLVSERGLESTGEDLSGLDAQVQEESARYAFMPLMKKTDESAYAHLQWQLRLALHRHGGQAVIDQWAAEAFSSLLDRALARANEAQSTQAAQALMREARAVAARDATQCAAILHEEPEARLTPASLDKLTPILAELLAGRSAIVGALQAAPAPQQATPEEKTTDTEHCSALLALYERAAREARLSTLVRALHSESSREPL